MDIADPDELVTFAVDPTSGAHSFFTDYNNPQVTKWTHEAERTFDKTKRQDLYNQIQAQAASDAFMGFLYYSPYRYAVLEQGSRLPGHAARQLPHGERLDELLSGGGNRPCPKPAR